MKLFLTATYNKPLHEWNITSENQMFWDIEDEQNCKNIFNNYISNIKDNVYYQNLVSKHGNYIDVTINYYSKLGYSIHDIFKPYTSMPDLHLITNIFDYERYDIIKQNIMGSKYGFSFDVLFSINSSKQFNYKREIKTILRYISGSEKEIDYKNGDISILSRINKLATRNPFTQIWFLPPDNINIISENLINLMNEDNILKNYNVMQVLIEKILILLKM